MNKISIVLLVSPGSKKPRVEKTLGFFKFFIKSPPVDGRANAEVCEIISKLLKIPKCQVKVEHGLSSKRKVVSIESGLSVCDVETALEAIVAVKK